MVAGFKKLDLSFDLVNLVSILSFKVNDLDCNDFSVFHAGLVHISKPSSTLKVDDSVVPNSG